MGRIQSSINQLIFQSTLIKSFSEKKMKEQEEKDLKLESKAEAQDNMAQKEFQKDLSSLEQKFALKATKRANDQIQSKASQYRTWLERRTKAIEGKQNMTAPHKPLPKKEE